MSYEVLYYLMALAFGAGGAYVLLKQSRKDVNGVGRKLNDELARSATRHHNVSLALMLLAGDEHREKVSELLKESHEEQGE